MAKWSIENCPYCKEETRHRVRIRIGKGKKPKGRKDSKKAGSGTYIKYMMELCTKCNKRRYKY